ncbi:WD40 repeat domain-containing protein [Micromonospora sp. CPCC 206061]|uniref:WD40 repeat domain-containing protein n=1 Tax=Micromonospora sp. CPCC 206061 TaxID=3122410 RepID=UPI002FF22092
MTARLARALADLAEQMPAAPVQDDLWRRGRRQRRRHHLAVAACVVVATLAVLLAVPALLARPAPMEFGDGTGAVPKTVYLPWMWQATVQQDPRGPAALLLSGDSIGLRGTDLIDHEGKIAVVGRDGSYRTLLYGGSERVAGEDTVLSPDGRYVAQDYLAGESYGRVLVTDLTTGKTKRYDGPDGADCCAVPVAWRPDGGALLLAQLRAGSPTEADPVSGNYLRPGRLVQLDLATGAALSLVPFDDFAKVRTASLAAYSPDGRRIAVATGERLRLLDAGTGATLWTAELGERRYLSGPGAFTADGQRIATVSLDGCLDQCDSARLAARQWRVDYLDANSGAEATGPAMGPVTAMAVRALGWRDGTDLVAVTYRPENGVRKDASTGWRDTGFWEVGDASLVALRPDGTVETLLDPPDAVLSIDVARDLLEAGRFGGEAQRPGVFPARWVIVVPVAFFGAPVVLLAGGVVLGWWLWRRRRRHSLTVRA